MKYRPARHRLRRRVSGPKAGEFFVTLAHQCPTDAKAQTQKKRVLPDETLIMIADEISVDAMQNKLTIFVT